jgi:UDP-N-acetylmuramoyl-L-alanyl-D-glutamate--2,6-diaminopimelate ligase
MKSVSTMADLLAPLQLRPELGLRDVVGVTADSRTVVPGTLFFALPGSKVDGLDYAEAAVAAGACAVVADRDPGRDLGVPVILADSTRGGARAALAHAAARYFGLQPATTVAITGTSGKTSVSVFTRQIWDELGHPAASLGTIGVVSRGGKAYGALTTPDPVTLQKTLAELAQDGITHCAMEASSHGLDQHRLDAVTIAASAFLNLSRDHLDYHATMEAYFAAKMRLLIELTPRGAPVVVVSADTWGKRAAATARDSGHWLITVGNGDDDVAIRSIMRSAEGQQLTVDFFGDRENVRLPLVGDFQAMNALAAAALCVATGSAPQAVLAALAKLKGVPGRLETVGFIGSSTVVVDYAHKPEALETALAALRPYAPGRVICVFGCGGDRDAGKRPIMGAVASERADVVIVTDDNPRSESAAAIRAAILAGAPGAIEIGDRAEAIHAAVDMLADGDLLVIAGKGHEDGQIVGDRTLPFSDRDVAQAAIAARLQRETQL